MVAQRLAARARARRSAGRSSTGSAGPTRRWCARSRSISPQVVAASPDTLGPTSTGSSRRARSRIRIDQDQARLLGLSSEAVAGVLNTVITGAPVTQVRDDIYLVNVRGPGHRRAARLAHRPCRRCRSRCPTAEPCRSASSRRSSITQDFPLIWRRDRVPTLTVQADVTPGMLPADGRGRARAGDRAGASRPAARLHHRDRRHGRGERRIAGFGGGRGAGRCC